MAKDKDFALEGLRGLACAAVATGHFCYIYFPFLSALFRPLPGVHPSFLLERFFQYPPLSLIFSADAAVSVFFVLSGYVLTTKYFSKGEPIELQNASVKRYVRLVIPVFAAVMFSWTLWRTGAIQTQQSVAYGAAGWVPMYYAGHYGFAGSIFNGLIGAPLFGNTVLDGPLWTIQVELIGSLLLFTHLATLGRHPVWLIFWFLFFADVLSFTTPQMLFYVSMLAGAYLNLAHGWLKAHVKFCHLLLIAGIIGLAFDHATAFDRLQAIDLPNFQPHGPNFNLDKQLFWNTFGAVAMVGAVIGLPWLRRLLAHRIPVFLGKISFSIYIIHWPILMSVVLIAMRLTHRLGLSYSSSVAISFLLFWVTVLVAAFLFYKFVDKPAIRIAAGITHPGQFGHFLSGNGFKRSSIATTVPLTPAD